MFSVGQLQAETIGRPRLNCARSTFHAYALPFNIVTIIAYFNGYCFTLKKGYIPEMSVLIDNFDTLR